MKSLAVFAAILTASALIAAPPSQAGERAHTERAACGLTKMVSGLRSRVRETTTMTHARTTTHTRRAWTWPSLRRTDATKTYKSRTR